MWPWEATLSILTASQCFNSLQPISVAFTESFGVLAKEKSISRIWKKSNKWSRIQFNIEYACIFVNLVVFSHCPLLGLGWSRGLPSSVPAGSSSLILTALGTQGGRVWYTSFWLCMIWLNSSLILSLHPGASFPKWSTVSAYTCRVRFL